MSPVRHRQMTIRGSAGQDVVRSGSRTAGPRGATAHCRGGSPAKSAGWQGCRGSREWPLVRPAKRSAGRAVRVVSSRPTRRFPGYRASAQLRRTAARRARHRWKTGARQRDPRPRAPLARPPASTGPQDEGPQGRFRFPVRGLRHQRGVLGHQCAHVQAVAKTEIQVRLHKPHPSPQRRRPPASSSTSGAGSGYSAALVQNRQGARRCSRAQQKPLNGLRHDQLHLTLRSDRASGPSAERFAAAPPVSITHQLTRGAARRTRCRLGRPSRPTSRRHAARR
jgi:hypothetical protein